MNIVLFCILVLKLEFSMKIKIRMLLGKRNRLGFFKKNYICRFKFVV